MKTPVLWAPTAEVVCAHGRAAWSRKIESSMPSVGEIRALASKMQADDRHRQIVVHLQVKYAEASDETLTNMRKARAIYVIPDAEATAKYEKLRGGYSSNAALEEFVEGAGFVSHLDGKGGLYSIERMKVKNDQYRGYTNHTVIGVYIALTSGIQLIPDDLTSAGGADWIIGEYINLSSELSENYSAKWGKKENKVAIFNLDRHDWEAEAKVDITRAPLWENLAKLMYDCLHMYKSDDVLGSKFLTRGACAVFQQYSSNSQYENTAKVADLYFPILPWKMWNNIVLYAYRMLKEPLDVKSVRRVLVNHPDSPTLLTLMHQMILADKSLLKNKTIAGIEERYKQLDRSANGRFRYSPRYAPPAPVVADNGVIVA